MLFGAKVYRVSYVHPKLPTFGQSNLPCNLETHIIAAQESEGNYLFDAFLHWDWYSPYRGDQLGICSLGNKVFFDTMFSTERQIEMLFITTLEQFGVIIACWKEEEK